MSYYGKIDNRYKHIIRGGKDMEEKISQVTKEKLKEMSIEEIVDLKVEAETLIEHLNNITDICNEILNS